MGEISGNISSIAHVIQIAVAPVFLLAGISALLAVMTARLGRIIDRSRRLSRGGKSLTEAEQALVDQERQDLQRRGHFINIGIALATSSALLVCLVIMILFLGSLISTDVSTLIAISFIVCMFTLIISLALFFAEVFLATRSMRKGLIRTEVLINAGDSTL